MSAGRRIPSPLGRIALGVLSTCALVGCDDRPLVIVAVGPLPEKPAELRASLTYNGKPALTPQPITFDLKTQLAGSTATFGARLPADTNGELVVSVGVLDNAGCLASLGAGALEAVRELPRLDIALSPPPSDVAHDDLCSEPEKTPLLLQVKPARGPSSGFPVTLIGWGFSCSGGSPQISVRGNPGANVVCRSLSEIGVDIPKSSGALGKVPLTISNTNGRMTTRGDLLSYYASDLRFDSPAPPYAVGISPSDLAVGLLDGDSRPDLAVTSSGDGKVTVRVNDGQGMFPDSRRSTIAVGSRPSGVAIADLNGDGFGDLAVSNSADNTVSLLLQDLPAVPLTWSARAPAFVNLAPAALRLVDVDGDGAQEVVVLHRVGSDVTVLKKDSQDRYVRVQDYVVGRDPVQLAVGDLNGDRAVDLAVASAGSGTVSILLSDRAGGFTSAATLKLSGSLAAVALGDVDGDGDLDLVAGGSGVWILRNDGTGQFAPATAAATDVRGPLSALALADLDLDGRPDLVVAAPSENRVYVLHNLARKDEAGFAAAVGYPVGVRPVALGLADFDGDGLVDIAVANQGDATVSILRNRSS